MSQNHEADLKAVEEVFSKIRLILKTLSNRTFTLSLSGNELVLEEKEVEPFIETLKKCFKKKRILNSHGEFCQNRSVCVDYLVTILAIVIDEYVVDHDMDKFLERFCFSPDNHLDRVCLAKIMQDKGMLNEFYQPINPEVEFILRSFQECTGCSPYEKAPMVVIESFIEDTLEVNNEVDPKEFINLNLGEY